MYFFVKKNRINVCSRTTFKAFACHKWYAYQSLGTTGIREERNWPGINVQVLWHAVTRENLG